MFTCGRVYSPFVVFNAIYQRLTRILEWRGKKCEWSLYLIEKKAVLIHVQKRTNRKVIAFKDAWVHRNRKKIIATALPWTKVIYIKEPPVIIETITRMVSSNGERRYIMSVIEFQCVRPPANLLTMSFCRQYYNHNARITTKETMCHWYWWLNSQKQKTNINHYLNTPWIWYQQQFTPPKQRSFSLRTFIVL